MVTNTYRLHFFTRILGLAPNNENIYRDFIASKAPDAQSAEEEIASVGLLEYGDKLITTFPRGLDGEAIFYDYQIKGFFKDACGMLAKVAGKDENGKKIPANESSKLKAYKKYIDGLIFPKPRMIPIQFDGEITECQRPLRASTPQGERNALAISEQINAPATMEFSVTFLRDDLVAAVEEWFDYGYFRGISQWRNAGNGRFVWEKLDENGKQIGGNYDPKNPVMA